MNRSQRAAIRIVLALGLAICGFDPVVARDSGFQVLHNFGSQGDGVNPSGGLIQDDAGVIIGTTFYGGTHGWGTVFKLTPEGSETVLHSFEGSPTDGAFPVAELLIDPDGSLYGTTSNGGSRRGPGNGTVFKIAPDQTETLLHLFSGAKKNGAYPYGGLIRDEGGNLIGTTLSGGNVQCGNGGCGLIFKIDSAGNASEVHRFKGWNYDDGAFPQGRLVPDKSGGFYGTTSGGGRNSAAGTMFKIDPDGKETILHEFGSSEDDGIAPLGLTRGNKGEMFGVTASGGGSGCGTDGCGTIYKIKTDGSETVLYRFNGADGRYPAPELAIDRLGNIYGTTAQGGKHNRGVVFKLDTNGVYTSLHDFCPRKGCADGWQPSGGPLIGQDGYLYGLTFKGGSDGLSGVIYRLRK